MGPDVDKVAVDTTICPASLGPYPWRVNARRHSAVYAKEELCGNASPLFAYGLLNRSLSLLTGHCLRRRRKTDVPDIGFLPPPVVSC